MKIKTVVVVWLLFIACVLGQNVSPSLVPQSANTDAATLQPIPLTKLAEPHYQADFAQVIANGRHSVSWDKGHLVSFGAAEMTEPVTLYDKAGKWRFETWPKFDGAVKVYGHDAVATSKGTAVLAAAALSGDGAMADVIAEVGQEGILRLIRTTPFRVMKVCATDKGDVWAYGEEMTQDRMAEARAHYPMLREYNFSKGELWSGLDRGTVHVPKQTALQGGRGEVQIRCGSHKVLFVNGLTSEVLEYDLDSSTPSRWQIAPLPDRFYINGAALTDSGEIYVSVFRPGQGALTGILHLHPNSLQTMAWTPLTMAPVKQGNFFVLLGSDGDSLVYSRGRSAPTLFWSKAQEQEPEVTK